MNFKIDLGLNKPDHTVHNLDLVAAAEAIGTVEMDLTKCETERAIVVAAAENLERGIQLSQAIAEKTQDETVALVVGKEALVASMRMLGQAEAGESVTAGAESFTAGVEASEGILKKILDKAKEYAKKAWDLVMKLMTKVSDLVSGMFKKGTDASSKLDKELKDLNKSKAKIDTPLKFDDGVAEAVVKKMAYTYITMNDKTINGAAIAKIFNYGGKILDTLLDGSTVAEYGFDIEAKIHKFNESVTYSDISTVMNDILGNTDLLDSNASLEFSALINDDDKKIIEDNLKSDDIERAVVSPIFFNGGALKLMVIYVSGDGTLINGSYNDTTSGYTLVSALNSIVNQIKVKVLTIPTEDMDMSKYEEYVKPLTFDDIEYAQKAMAKFKKDHNDKVLKSSKKALEDIEKTNIKTLDALSKEYKKDDYSFENEVVKLNTHIIQLQNNIALTVAKAFPEFGKEMISPACMSIIDPSIAEFKKSVK